jgi:rare lipoprotein A
LSAAERTPRRAWHGAPPVTLLLLAGCAHAPPHPSPAHPPAPASSPTTVLPRNAPDVYQVPDAVPRDEPRSAFGNPPFYYVAGHRYVVLPSANGYVERGVASWYGTEFHGLRTSTGEPYDMFAMTAAHKTLPLPCYARVTNLSNGRSVVVRINDRGPFVANRIIDLSYSAAARLDIIRNGTGFVQVEVLTPAAPTLNASMPVNAPAAQAVIIGVSSVPPVSVPQSNATPPVSTPPGTPPASATAASSAAAGTAAPSSSFYIQVGAYSRQENASAAVNKLRAAGMENVLTLAADTRQPLQRVRVGPIANVQQFDATIERLNALGFPNARLAQD